MTVLSRRVGAVASVLGALVYLGFAGAGPAGATGGTWGGGAYPYLDGKICNVGATTSPLASWDLGNGYAPAFLTEQVTSTAGIDSAAIPTSAAVTQFPSPVAPGEFGLNTQADVAALAYLIGQGGSAGTTSVEDVAQIVLNRADPSNTLSGCFADASGEQRLLAQAQAMAGPYTVTVSSVTAQIGQNASVSAVVKSAAGHPVPGVLVTFGGAALGTGTTDATGTAKATVNVPVGTTVPSEAVTASVTLPTGLVSITGTIVPTTSDPSGQVATAVAVAQPTATTGQGTVTINLTANPVLSVSYAPPVVQVGGLVTPTLSVTGMAGHAANVTITDYGPVTPPAGQSCAGLASSAFTSLQPFANGVASIIGDSKVTGQSWTATKPGCYAVGAKVTTTDSQPSVTATVTPSGSDSVTAFSATATLGAVDNGTTQLGKPISATVTVSQTDGSTVVIGAKILGPMTPGNENCAGVNWANAPANLSVAEETVKRDGTYLLQSAPARKQGCYQVNATIGVTVGGGGTASVPVTEPATTNAVSVVNPTVTQTTVNAYSVLSPQSFSVQTLVAGLYGKAAHIAVRMTFVGAPTAGCRSADATHAQVSGSGPSVAVQGAPTLMTLTSGATTSLGCYFATPVVTMDDNPTITSAVAGANSTSSVLAGVGIVTPKLVSIVRSGSLVRSLIAYAVAMLLIFGVAAVVALRSLPWRRPVTFAAAGGEGLGVFSSGGPG